MKDLMTNSNTTIKKLRLGDEITTYCGKCKDERLHAIISFSTQSVVDRVQCRTCQGVHIFRVKRSEGAAPRTVKSSSARSVAIDNNLPLRNYSIKERFSVGDRISHSKFGSGTVTGVRDGKIDVRFGKDVRILIHAC